MVSDFPAQLTWLTAWVVSDGWTWPPDVYARLCESPWNRFVMKNFLSSVDLFDKVFFFLKGSLSTTHASAPKVRIFCSNYLVTLIPLFTVLILCFTCSFNFYMFHWNVVSYFWVDATMRLNVESREINHRGSFYTHDTSWNKGKLKCPDAKMPPFGEICFAFKCQFKAPLKAMIFVGSFTPHKTTPNS